MNRPRQDSQANKAGAALALTRELHEHLLVALVDKFGDDLRVEDAHDPENGVVGYRFEIHGAVCSAAIAPFNGVSVVLSFNGRLGRVYRGYAKALRWLGQNRAFNTLAVAHQEAAAQARDLWVAANRNTLSGDIAGIRVELDDFCAELGKATTGLRLWFPQFFEAGALSSFERDATQDERLAVALAAPRAALGAIEESDEAMQNHSILYCYLTRWLGEWERNLRMLDSPQLRALANEQPDLQVALPTARLRALRALGRHEELLNEVLPTLSASDLPTSRNAALRAECLCELDREEDAIETLQAAELDDDPWVHFIRSYACMKLDRQEEAGEHFAQYESMIGADMLASLKIAALAREDESASSE